MKGLMLRGFYNIVRPKTLVTILCLILFEVLMTVLMALNPYQSYDPLSPWITGMIIGYCLSFCIMSVIFEDESSRFLVYCVNTPVSRKKYVTSQFVVMSVFNAVVLLISLLCPVMQYIRTGSFDAKQFVLGAVSIYLLSELVISVILPISLRFGKNNYLMLLILMVMILLFGFAVTGNIMEKLGELIANTDNLLLAVIELPVIIFIVLLSWLITVKLFSKRQF